MRPCAANMLYARKTKWLVSPDIGLTPKTSYHLPVASIEPKVPAQAYAHLGAKVHAQV